MKQNRTHYRHSKYCVWLPERSRGGGNRSSYRSRPGLHRGPVLCTWFGCVRPGPGSPGHTLSLCQWPTLRAANSLPWAHKAEYYGHDVGICTWHVTDSEKATGETVRVREGITESQLRPGFAGGSGHCLQSLSVPTDCF